MPVDTYSAHASLKIKHIAVMILNKLRMPCYNTASSVLKPQTSRSNLVVYNGRRAAKIALRKGKSDAKKAKVYGRVGKKIIQYVKSGGADPVTNAKLDTLIKQAKDLGVPRDIIDRNIKRASDTKQADFLELCYEAYGPGGTGFIVECLTDNVNRSAGDVKAIITKSGNKVAEPGSVMFNFARCGAILVEDTKEDIIFEAAMEAGAEDVCPLPEDEDGNPSTSYKVFTPVEEFSSATATLTKMGFKVNLEESELVYRASTPLEVDDEAFGKCETLMERLLEHDDVEAVYTNCDGLQV
ncbi:hypothetical protein CEUSTIGMA_g5304.t1 [Chlamydomonas eustigma]|uniref:Transcriptional regulatory protein n=1 Tax=Chlamydomonas eustigma TaxID=1157962 RepID=A0A250X4P8_9CHLO|nr:hypothetical protein CEUSTIGMA_g5304.t1 [Chlamydomonas eustigma]|eukprot:GAX77862.1 hypothetical protein CEUSTIGMA_g5304.t1 [Chlamydomonas eustigma]